MRNHHLQHEIRHAVAVLLTPGCRLDLIIANRDLLPPRVEGQCHYVYPPDLPREALALITVAGDCYGLGFRGDTFGAWCSQSDREKAFSLAHAAGAYNFDNWVNAREAE